MMTRCMAYHTSESGSALVVTLVLLALVSVELAVLSVVLTRGLGDEGLLVSQHIAARQAADVALDRLSNRLYRFLTTHSPRQAQEAFSKNGRQAIRGDLLQITHPSDGTQETTGVTLYAWVKEQRGHFYHLVGQGKMGRINLSVHRWIQMNPCNPQGRLTKILDHAREPATPFAEFESVLHQSSGRLFVREFLDKSLGARAWIHDPDQGLILLGNRFNYPGFESTAVHQKTGRFFFGEREGRLWMWDPQKGLSAIFTPVGNSAASPRHVLVDEETGRIYFNDASAHGGYYTWHPHEGLTALGSKDDFSNHPMSSLDPIHHRIYFASDNRLWTWQNDTGLLAIYDGPENAFSLKKNTPLTVDTLRERVFFPITGTGDYMMWSPATGLKRLAAHGATNQTQSLLDPLTGRLVWHDGRIVRTWHETSGLSVISPASVSLQADSLFVDASGWFYFVSTWPSRQIHRWHPEKRWEIVTSLPTATRSFPLTVDPIKHQLYIGSSEGLGHLTAWNMEDGLKVIARNLIQPGYKDKMLLDKESGRLFFGDNSDQSSLWTWDFSDGLQPVMQQKKGLIPLATTEKGGLYFGQNLPDGGILWKWTPSYCNHRGF